MSTSSLACRGEDPTPEAQSVDRSRVAGRIAIGWLLLCGFAIYVAWSGSIGGDVRAFQFAYLVGFAGFLILLFTVVSNVATTGLGRWRWWFVGCVLLRAALGFSTPSDDVHRYAWEGKIQLAGYDPYQHSPNDPRLEHLRDDQWLGVNHKDFPAIYPPLAQLEFRFVAAISHSVLAVKALHTLWDVLTLAALAACLRAQGKKPHLAIAYGLCPLVLTAFAIEGHLDSLMLLLVAICVWASMNERVYLAGGCLGAAIGAKIVAIVLLPWMLIHRPRAILAVAGVLAVLYVLHPTFASHGLETLQRFADRAPFFSVGSVLGLTNGSRFQSAITLGILAIVIGWLAWPRRPFPMFAAPALGVLLLVLPVVHYWYFAWPLLLSPWGLRWRWLSGALAMVVYFEAEHRLGVAGRWVMPAWAPMVVWGSVAAGWVVDLIAEKRRAGLLPRRG